MEEQITLDPALTSGVDEGIGRRGVDWDYVKQAVAQHHQTERDANRRRGQSTFNRLIGQGVSYADALRQAGDDGLFFGNEDAQMRAEQHIADQKQKETLPQREIIRSVPGIGLGRVTSKGWELIQAEGSDKKNTHSGELLRSLQDAAKNSDNPDVKAHAAASVQSLQSAMGERIPGFGVTTNVIPAVPSNSWGFGGKPAQTNYAPARVSAPAQIPESPIVAPAQSSSTISTKAQFDALEPGAIYIGKDGKRRRKP